MFVDKTYFQHFYTGDQIWLLILAIFLTFYWFVSFIFDKSYPSSWIYVSKYALNLFISF